MNVPRGNHCIDMPTVYGRSTERPVRIPYRALDVSYLHSAPYMGTVTEEVEAAWLTWITTHAGPIPKSSLETGLLNPRMR